MKWRLSRSGMVRAAAVGLLAAAAGLSLAADKPPVKVDITKSRLETGAKKIVEALGQAQQVHVPPAGPPDRPKSAIEAPAKAVVAGSGLPTPPQGPGQGYGAKDSDNPKVEPGKVNWHPSFAAACEAAQTSKKPVLLFQMLGKLDDQFC